MLLSNFKEAKLVAACRCLRSRARTTYYYFAVAVLYSRETAAAGRINKYYLSADTAAHEIVRRYTVTRRQNTVLTQPTRTGPPPNVCDAPRNRIFRAGCGPRRSPEHFIADVSANVSATCRPLRVPPGR